jgi:crossover junction endodeoxyribonuclease RuvC
MLDFRESQIVAEANVTSSVFLGIDPGAGGAVAAYVPRSEGHDEVLHVVDMPTFVIQRGKREVRHVDPAGLARIMAEQVGPRTYACVEKVGAMPGQGVASMFAFGRAAGVIEGVLAGLQLRYDLVSPQVWQRAMRVVGGKDGARQRASQLFPRHAGLFARAKDDGRADAALLAYYAYTTWGAK